MEFEILKDVFNGNSDVKELSKHHPAEIANELHEFEIEQVLQSLKQLKPAFSAKVIVETHDVVREKLLELCDIQTLMEWIDTLPTDESAFLCSQLPEEKQEVILAKIPFEERQGVSEILAYEEDQIGSMMQKEVLKIKSEWTTSKAVESLRDQTDEDSIDNYHKAYVVDNDDILQGEIPLMKLLIARPNLPIASLISEVDIETTADLDTEEVAQNALKHNAYSVPVVDENRKLIGRVTLDDLGTVLQQEFEEDIGKMSGTGEEAAIENFHVSIRERLPWLLFGLVGGIILVFLLGAFEGRMKEHPEFVFFIPLIMSMAGNIGIQSCSIIVRGLSTGDIGISDFFPRLFREISLTLINGGVCSFCILIFGFIFFEEKAIGVLVAISLFAVMLIAALFGVAIPLLLKMVKIEPAYATGPFITIGNDVMGITIFMGLGKWMLENLL